MGRIMKLNQFLPENVKTHGVSGDAAEYYANVSNHLASELKIPESIKVVVNFNYKHEFVQGHNGSTLPDLMDDNTIHIYLRPGLDRATLLRALCHEFVHVQQIASGRLVFNIKNEKLAGMEWEGEAVEPPNYNRSSEWELEAHTKEKDLLQSVIGAVGNLMN